MFDTLSLEALEEASGELLRRVGVALRRIGEAHADDDAAGRSPRWHVAALAASMELAAVSLAAVVAGGSPPDVRTDRQPATVSALMYATPRLDALLVRLEQDRRLLASLARSLEERLPEAHPTPWGGGPLRRLLSEIAIAEPARCAQRLEAFAAVLDAQEAEAAAREAGEL